MLELSSPVPVRLLLAGLRLLPLPPVSTLAFGECDRDIRTRVRSTPSLPFAERLRWLGMGSFAAFPECATSCRYTRQGG
jgi:hypothetical protein